MNIGDYVRTLEYIRKIRKIKDNYVYCDIGVFCFNEIIKSSPNIIDLIEVGDYVNGSKVYHKARTDIDDYGNNFKEVGIESDKYLYYWVEEKDIKSIVTKEQFESMEYKIGE